MSVTTDELQALANEIHAQLFPMAGPRGQPLPLPVEVEVDGVSVLFVPERIIRRVGEPAPDVPVSTVRVFVNGRSTGSLCLRFGEEPDVSAIPDSVVPLLRSVTGCC